MKMLEQDYTLLPINKLDPHPGNPNQGNREALDDSVDTTGFYGAVIVRPKGNRYEILAGEHRYRKLVDEGVARVPAIVVEHLDEVDAMRIMLADNEVTRRGRNRKDLLDQVINKLGSLEGTGIDLSALRKHEETRKPDPPDEEEPASTVYGVLVRADSAEDEAELFEVLAQIYGRDRAARLGGTR